MRSRPPQSRRDPHTLPHRPPAFLSRRGDPRKIERRKRVQETACESLRPPAQATGDLLDINRDMAEEACRLIAHRHARNAP